MTRKAILVGLLHLLAVVGILGVIGCADQTSEESRLPPEAASITGTYVWDMDPHFYIKLEENGKFSFRGKDEFYSGTWELEDSDGIVLHFPTGSVYFTSKGDYDWEGTIQDKALGMEPSAGSMLLGTSVGGYAFFEKS